MTETTQKGDFETAEEIGSYLNKMFRLSMTIVSAKNGSECAKQELQSLQTVEGRFPGNRDRAMGHALVIEEDLEALGISARREYVGEIDTGHRIDIHIE